MPSGKKIKKIEEELIEVKPKNPNPSATETSQEVEIQMEWLGLRQLRSYAPVSERTLRSWIHSPLDPLPAVRVKGKILVRKSVFDDWLERHTIESLANLRAARR